MKNIFHGWNTSTSSPTPLIYLFVSLLLLLVRDGDVSTVTVTAFGLVNVPRRWISSTATTITSSSTLTTPTDRIPNQQQNQNQQLQLQQRETPYNNPSYIATYQKTIEKILHDDFGRGGKHKHNKHSREDILFVKKLLLVPYRLVDINLASLLGDDDDDNGSANGESGGDVRNELIQQKHKYALAATAAVTTFTTNTNSSSSSKPRIFTNDHALLASKTLANLGQQCAAGLYDEESIHVAFDKIKEMGLEHVGSNGLGTFLYVLGKKMGSSITTSSSNDVIDVDATNGEQKQHSPNFPNNNKKPYDFSITLGEIAMIHDALHQPTENTISLRIKLYAEQKGDYQKSEELLKFFDHVDVPLNSHEILHNHTDTDNADAVLADANNKNGSKQSKNNNNRNKHKQKREKRKKKKLKLSLRLRTCLPLVHYYCSTGRMEQAWNLYQRMRNCPTVLIDDDTYALFIGSLAKFGYFCGDGSRINGSTTENDWDDTLSLSSSSTSTSSSSSQLSTIPKNGSQLFNQVVSDMAEDVLEISEDCTVRIRNGLAFGFQKYAIDKTATSTSLLMPPSILLPVPSDCTMRPITFEDIIDTSSDSSSSSSTSNSNNINQPLLAHRVTIPETTGLCPLTKVKLQLIQLSLVDKVTMIQTLLRMAHEQHVTFGAKYQNHNNNNNNNQNNNNGGGNGGVSGKRNNFMGGGVGPPQGPVNKIIKSSKEQSQQSPPQTYTNNNNNNKNKEEEEEVIVVRRHRVGGLGINDTTTATTNSDNVIVAVEQQELEEKGEEVITSFAEQELNSFAEWLE